MVGMRYIIKFRDPVKKDTFTISCKDKQDLNTTLAFYKLGGFKVEGVWETKKLRGNWDKKALKKLSRKSRKRLKRKK